MFAAQERAGLIFQANSKPVIDFTLKLGSVAEATTVHGVAPILETRKAELSLTVDQQKIETMPLNGRNYLDLANFANGVHGAAARGDISVNGQLGRNIDYVVDGVSNKVIEWGDASKTAGRGLKRIHGRRSFVRLCPAHRGSTSPHAGPAPCASTCTIDW